MYRRVQVVAGCLFAGLLLAPSTSVAATITFDGVTVVTTGGTLNPISQLFTEDGFVVEAFWGFNLGLPVGSVYEWALSSWGGW